MTTQELDRNEAIRRIRAGLKKRSGRKWSVTGGTGATWGWITITSGRKNDDLGEADQKHLAELMGLDGPVHRQGLSIPASFDYRIEHVDRAEGRTPSRIGKPCWD